MGRLKTAHYFFGWVAAKICVCALVTLCLSFSALYACLAVSALRFKVATRACLGLSGLVGLMGLMVDAGLIGLMGLVALIVGIKLNS